MALAFLKKDSIMKNNQKKLFRLDDFTKPNPTMFGSFRETVGLFLDEFAELEEYSINGMSVWRTLLATETAGVLELYILEETLQMDQNSALNIPFCNHCKLSGWGHHFVCKRKYHLIIPAKEPLKGNFAEIRTHCLYGLIHCNGYGHLICVNGLKRNLRLFTASDAMEFWDSLCNLLKARMISVSDFLSEGAAEARLIHGISFGQPWHGRWGYKLNNGCSNITKQKYDWAIQYLSSLSLARIVDDFNYKENGKKIKQLIKKYQELSEKPLVTIRDLLRFMVDFEPRNSVNACWFKSETKESVMGFEAFVDSMAKGDCRWSPKRLEDVLLVIVRSLKDRKASTVNGKCGMSRHELREHARKYIGDTGLIDFVLKSIKCFQVDNLVICRGIDPAARLVEFTIHDLDFIKEAELMKLPVLDYDCRWSRDKVEDATKVLVSILRENRGNRAMGLQELHDKARLWIDNANLIDFVLKLLDNSGTGNHVAYPTKNPITKRIDFSLAENLDVPKIMDIVMGMNFHQDVQFLYENVLLGYPETSSESLATRMILESKHFTKEWSVEGEVVDQFMTLICKVLPSFDEMETVLTRPLSPGAVVLVPPSLTIAQLKLAAQCALRDTYCIMDEFVVTQIGGLRAIEDDRLLTGAVKPGAHVWVRGSGLDLTTWLRYEDGGDLSYIS